MAIDNDLNSSGQQLAPQLETLRKDLYKLVDETISKIAHACVGMSADELKNVVASIFQSISQSGNEFMAGAAPAMATHRSSPRTAEKQITEPRRRGRRAVWANSSDASLRIAYSKRVHAGKTIEPELEAELAKRFPTYDVKTHKFTGRARQPKIVAPIQRKTDWAKSSDMSLRQAYANRIKGGKAIEPELESELIKRFPGYDAATHKFTGRGRSVKTVATPVAGPQFDNDVVALTRLSSPQNKYGKYPLMFDGNTVLMLGAKTPYELVLFDKKTQVAVVRKKAENLNHKLFIVRCKKGTILEDMRTGARDIRYIPETHQLMAREMQEAVKRFMVYTPSKATEMWTVVPSGAISVSARQILKETIVIEKDGRVTTYPLINLAGVEYAAKKAKTETTKKTRKPRVKKSQGAPAPTPAPVMEQKAAAPAPVVAEPKKQEPVAKPTPTPAPAPKPVSNPDLVVTKQLTKMTLGAAFYDVYVNGKRILQNHIDTEIELFLDGTVLGVFGRVTDIDNFPDIPSWQVYDTNLRRRDFSYVSTFSKKSVFIKSIRQINDTQLVLNISNKMQVILDKKNVPQVFKIASEKTK